MTRTAACATSILSGLIAAEPVVHLVQHAALNRFYTNIRVTFDWKDPKHSCEGQDFQRAILALARGTRFTRVSISQRSSAACCRSTFRSVAVI